MLRSFLYSALMLVVAAAGVANERHERIPPPAASASPGQEPRLASCDEAVLAARRSPYWRHQSLPFEVECRPALGGWRLRASTTEPDERCELYVGRDRLIVPRLPCQGVGAPG